MTKLTLMPVAVGAVTTTLCTPLVEASEDSNRGMAPVPGDQFFPRGVGWRQRRGEDTEIG